MAIHLQESFAAQNGGDESGCNFLEVFNSEVHIFKLSLVLHLFFVCLFVFYSVCIFSDFSLYFQSVKNYLSGSMSYTKSCRLYLILIYVVDLARSVSLETPLS